MTIGCVGISKVTAIADNQTVHDVGASTSPTYDTAAVCGGFAQNGNLCQTVLYSCAAKTSGNNTAVSGITWHRAVDGNVNIATTNGTIVFCHDTCSELVASGNSTRHLQVLDDGSKTSVLEEGCFFFLWVHVDFDGMSFTIKGTSVLVVARTNHCTIDASVDVGCQLGIGIDISLIHEYSELFQVRSRTNLIDSIHVGKSPCSCGDNAKKRCQTQIQ